MNADIFSPFQIREVFHLEFLRWLGRKLPMGQYCLKGGVNLRLFFKSIRYSEDMDIDITGVLVQRLQKTTMEILTARGFCDGLKSFGIEGIVAPDITKAKQTQTTQRFKIHLLTSAGEDPFTKVEFSRRDGKGSALVEPVTAEILRAYKMAPLLVRHYDVVSAIVQKIQALAQRAAVQARDVFDLFVLSSQLPPGGAITPGIKQQLSTSILETAQSNIFLIEFPQFRDTVLPYLEVNDQKTYASPSVWDEIKLRAAHLLEEFGHENR